VLLGDGTLMADGALKADGALMSDGVLLGDNILTSSGALMSDGAPFLGCSSLFDNGVLLGDGSLLGDGVLLGDGALLGDGVLLGDVYVQATKVLVQGDNTASMVKVVEAALPPNAPASLAAAAASKTQINLKWADASNDETGFKVERSADGVTFAQIATLAANSTSYASTSLTGGKRYYYRVRAYNANGNSAYTAVVTATTPTK
jgi:hypothetical protein